MHLLQGLYVDFSQELDPQANARIHALCDRLLADLLPGISDLYPGYINLYVEFDAAVIERARVRAWIGQHLEDLSPKPSGREVVVPVRYDGEDLPWVAEQTGLSVEEVIRRHSERPYRVYTVGFVPGQPMMGTLDPALYLPRRPTPRKRVEANTLAMAVSQTCVYTLPTPGGWHLLGTTLEAIYHPQREPPFLLDSGDTVRFVPSEGTTPPGPEPLQLLPPEPKNPVFRVDKPGLLDLVVDQGRFMAARYGMARSGPMDERSARLANALVGNPEHAPLLELTLLGPALTALQEVVVGFAGFGLEPVVNDRAVPAFESLALHSGDQLWFRPSKSGVRAYLAVPGGFEVGEFMGSHSTDLQGLIGRALRAGDVLGMGKGRRVRAGFRVRPPVLPDNVVLRLLPGPQATPGALKALASEFSVANPDRMGLRLKGPKIPGGELISEATPMGTVQITTEGDPIVLLNDRGRIGGYAKPAVVDPRDWPLLAQLRPGQKIRFKPSFSGELHDWLDRWRMR